MLKIKTPFKMSSRLLDALHEAGFHEALISTYKDEVILEIEDRKMLEWKLYKAMLKCLVFID